MKRFVVGLFAAGLSFAALAMDAQTAKELYDARGADTQNAVKAHAAYVELAKAATDKTVATEYYWRASLAVYYVGLKAKNNADQKKWHEQGMATAKAGIALLENAATTEEQKETLANALYHYGVNLGKWGEANGVASSLGKWPELEETMKKIIKLNKAYVQDFGAYRTLGRALYKLPWPLGSNAKALKFLETAVEKTKNGHPLLSQNALNNVFYAQVLIAEKQKDKARQILEALIAVDAKTFNPDRVPETLMDQADAREVLRSL